MPLFKHKDTVVRRASTMSAEEIRNLFSSWTSWGKVIQASLNSLTTYPCRTSLNKGATSVCGTMVTPSLICCCKARTFFSGTLTPTPASVYLSLRGANGVKVKVRISPRDLKHSGAALVATVETEGPCTVWHLTSKVHATLLEAFRTFTYVPRKETRNPLQIASWRPSHSYP